MQDCRIQESRHKESIDTYKTLGYKRMDDSSNPRQAACQQLLFVTCLSRYTRVEYLYKTRPVDTSLLRWSFSTALTSAWMVLENMLPACFNFR